jgi:hypothetical protein
MHERFSAAEPGAFGRWLLPLLYQRLKQPLLVQSIPSAMAQRIEDVARTLRAMSSDTPTDLRDQILAILDKEPAVLAGLRPDRYGNFA